MMRYALLLVLLLPALAPRVQAQMLWVEGDHYERISPAVPPSTPGKVEVTEVFSYGCPYCYAALPLAERIASSLPPYAQMNLVHASFIPTEGWPMFQRAFLTAKALGIAEANHKAFFEAIWDSGEFPLIDPATRRPVQPLPNIAQAAKFYAKHAGIKEEDFLARSRQPDIDEAVRSSDALVKAWAVPGTPSFIVNGKYRTGKGIKTSDDMVRVILYLVSLEKPKS